MKTVDPNPEKLMDLLGKIPEDTPVVMINFLRFREKARYRDGEPGISGREAYDRYAAVALKKLMEIGASVMYLGSVHAGLIAPPDEIWHEALLVRYPSVQAFIRMISMPDYLEATAHRTAALDDSRLIATSAGR
jgi:uncharacterized protein (DUF1330 family)